MKKGFDSREYTRRQTSQILERISRFDNKLYLDPDRELMEKLRLRYQERGCPVGCGT